MSGLVQELLQRCATEIGLELTSDKLEKFLQFASELKKWNRKINLTAITDDKGIALKHFADSFLLLKVLGDCANLLDIGSGGGFPSIPVKIMLPTLSVVSVDAVEKKILFQRHIARVLGIDNFTAVHSRCEALPQEFEECFDVVVSRAFSDIISFARLASPYLRQNGHMIAMKGKGGASEVSEAQSGLLRMGIVVKDIKELMLPVSGEHRCFIIMQKKT